MTAPATRARAALAALEKLGSKKAASEEPPARWIGKDALRELTGPVVKRKLAAKG